MLKHGLTLLLCALVASSGGCKRRDSTPPPPKNQADANSGNQSGGPTFDACKLLTNQEIESIEASPVKDTKPSGRLDAGLSLAQCFYTTAEFNRSVSLSVTQPDPRGNPKRDVRQLWKETFASKNEDPEKESEADKEKRESLREQKGERGEEERRVPPKKVEGVGEEAFWLGNRVGGALYVLKNDAFIRVSVGGPDPEDKKIEKCKALAAKALNRM